MTLNFVEANPVIKLIPQNIHKKLFGYNYDEITHSQTMLIKNELDKFGLTDLKDTSELANIYIPKLSAPLPQWLDQIIEETYKIYFNSAEKLRYLNYLDVPRVSISPFYGWSKFESNQWVACDGITEDSIIFDFETYPDDNGVMRPFMCSAIDCVGTIYSWLADVEKPLPEVVSFGEECKLYVGHNSVSFDRRYIKEFYDFGHDKRMLDTFSLYFVLLGMSSDQIKTYRWARYKDPAPFQWVNSTTNGNLKDLSEFLLGVVMDKTVREDLLKPKTVKGKLEVTPKEVIKQAMSEIWDYCLFDTINTGRIFSFFIARVLEYETKIYLAGQLERSTLRIAVTPDIKEKINKVVQYNNGQLCKINQVILEQLEIKLKEQDPYVLSMLEGYVTKDWYERIYKSKKFQDYLNQKNAEELIKNIELPAPLLSLGWEYDDEESKRSVRKNKTLAKLGAVHNYLLEGRQTKIQKKTITQWVTKLLKDPNEKISEAHISVAGKIAPVIIGLRWHGERLFVKGNTWGVTVDGEFVALPHTKGKKNVGTPLSKDYAAFVSVGRFTADIDLKLFFDVVNETSLWEKFNKRFRAIYIHKNIWLPQIVPSGAITGRMAGSLAVVMANPDVDKKTGVAKKAGSEMKSWFMVEEGHVKVNADYSGQESEIFAALIDAVTKFPGLNIFSCLVHAGNSDLKTDIHSFVARYLSGECGGEFPRTLAKNCNFANQFLCGSPKLATMIFIALEGLMSEEECLVIAKKFQAFTRGSQAISDKGYTYGDYEDGIASIGFNKVKELSNKNNQKCLLTGRVISDPLNAKNTRSDLTTRVNFNIQGTGQGLVDVCTIVTRYLCNKFNVPYNLSFMIHDDIHNDTLEKYENTIAYFMQIGHLFSKALLYYKFGVEAMPLNKMFFETVEQDKYLRKSPLMSYLTPTQTEPLPLGKVVKANDCQPLPEILKILKTMCI